MGQVWERVRPEYLPQGRARCEGSALGGTRRTAWTKKSRPKAARGLGGNQMKELHRVQNRF
ncbi:hypothetical protein [Azospirillum doebereinerae]